MAATAPACPTCAQPRLVDVVDQAASADRLFDVDYAAAACELCR